MSQSQNQFLPTKVEFATVPPEIAKLLGRRPLSQGESTEDYDSLLGAFAEAICPANAVEWVWVKDITDATWELQRAQNARTKLVDASLMANAIGIRRFGRNDGEVFQAEGYSNGLGVVRAIDRMIAVAMTRRDAVLREIERRRFDIARRLKLEAWDSETPARNKEVQPQSLQCLPNQSRVLCRRIDGAPPIRRMPIEAPDPRPRTARPPRARTRGGTDLLPIGSLPTVLAPVSSCLRWNLPARSRVPNVCCMHAWPRRPRSN